MNETIIEKTTIRSSEAETEETSETMPGYENQFRKMSDAAGEIAVIAGRYAVEFGGNYKNSTALAVLRMAMTIIVGR